MYLDLTVQYGASAHFKIVHVSSQVHPAIVVFVPDLVEQLGLRGDDVVDALQVGGLGAVVQRRLASAVAVQDALGLKIKANKEKEEAVKTANRPYVWKLTIAKHTCHNLVR